MQGCQIFVGRNATYPTRLSMSMLLWCFRVARFEATEDVEFRIQLLSQCRKSMDWWKKNVIHSHLIGNVSIMSRTWYFVMSFCIRSSLNKLFDFLHVDHQQGQISFSGMNLCNVTVLMSLHRSWKRFNFNQIFSDHRAFTLVIKISTTWIYWTN